MNEEPTLNDKLTLLAQKCPGLWLYERDTDLWMIMPWSDIENEFVAGDRRMLDSTDGTDLFCRRVVRELESLGKFSCLHIYFGEKAGEGYIKVEFDTQFTFVRMFSQPNEVERYATALHQVVVG